MCKLLNHHLAAATCLLLSIASWGYLIFKLAQAIRLPSMIA